MHYMQLLPVHGMGVRLSYTSFEDNLRRKVMAIRNATDYPIFHTMNYVCDERYAGKWANTIRDPAKFEAKNKIECSKYAQEQGASQHPANGSAYRSVEVCWQFRFTAAGSHIVVAKEQRMMEAASPPLRRIVDRFNTSRGQCWATDEGDGRHYLPLLPYAIKTALSFASECLSPSNVP